MKVDDQRRKPEIKRQSWTFTHEVKTRIEILTVRGEPSIGKRGIIEERLYEEPLNP
jgi:hypothetical protein